MITMKFDDYRYIGRCAQRSADECDRLLTARFTEAAALAKARTVAGNLRREGAGADGEAAVRAREELDHKVLEAFSEATDQSRVIESYEDGSYLMRDCGGDAGGVVVEAYATRVRDL